MAHDRIKSVPFCMLICALQGRKLSGCLIQLEQFLMVLRCVEILQNLLSCQRDPNNPRSGTYPNGISPVRAGHLYRNICRPAQKRPWFVIRLGSVFKCIGFQGTLKFWSKSIWWIILASSVKCVCVYLSLGTRVVLFSWSYLSYRNCSSYFLHCLVWSFSRRILLLLLPLP